MLRLGLLPSPEEIESSVLVVEARAGPGKATLRASPRSKMQALDAFGGSEKAKKSHKKLNQT